MHIMVKECALVADLRLHSCLLHEAARPMQMHQCMLRRPMKGNGPLASG